MNNYVDILQVSPERPKVPAPLSIISAPSIPKVADTFIIYVHGETMAEAHSLKVKLAETERKVNNGIEDRDNAM